MNNDILNFCLKKGFLLDREVLNLVSGNDSELVKLIIEKIGSCTQKKFITKSVLYENKEKVNQFFLNLPEENQKKLENLKIKLGLSIEISRKSGVEIQRKQENKISRGCVSVESFSSPFQNLRLRIL